MLYTDGMTAILVFTGVYAAGVMHWHTLELLAYGILPVGLRRAWRPGGSVAGRRHFGSKRAVQIEILGAFDLFCCVLGMGVEPHPLSCPTIRPPHAPLWHGPISADLAGGRLSGDRVLQRRVRHRAVRLQPHLPEPPGARRDNRPPSSASTPCQAR